MRQTRVLPAIICIFILLLPACTFADTPATITSVTTPSQPGYYRVHANVEGAYVYMDNTFRGVIDHGILIIPLPPGSDPFSSLKVWKEGYTTYIVPVYTQPAPGEYYDITTTLQQIPLAGPGTITLLSNPPGTAVFLDGISKGTVPDTGVLILDKVPAGDHQVRLTLEGYDSQQKGVYVPSDGIARVSFTLQPATAGGMSIVSGPPGATVTIDDMNTGITPLNVSGLTPGTHTVRLSLPGYSDLYLTSSVTAGRITMVSGNLTLLPPPTAPPTTRAGISAMSVFLAGCTAFLLCSLRRH